MASREEEATSTALEGGAEELPPVPADRMFEAKPVWKRFIVLIAGVTMNVLFAWLVFSGLALKNGRAVNPVTTVGAVDEAFVPPGAEAIKELRTGDRITAINGTPVTSWTDIDDAFMASGESLDFTLADGRTVTVPVHADAVESRLRARGGPAAVHRRGGGAGDQGAPGGARRHARRATRSWGWTARRWRSGATCSRSSRRRRAGRCS